MAQKQRHHTVPAFYLRRFAHNNELSVVDCQNMTKRLVSPRDAAVRCKFYEAELHDGSRSMLVEDVLAELENATAPVLAEIASGEFPGFDSEERFNVALFLTLQFLRTQRARTNMDNFMIDVSRLVGELIPEDWIRQVMTAESGGVIPTDEEVAKETEAHCELARTIELTIEGGKTAHVKRMLETSKELMPSVLYRTMLVFEFEQPLLLTSDNPLVPIGPTSGRTAFQGFGLGNAEDLIYPLDPSHALVLSLPRVGVAESVIPSTSEVAHSFNNCVANDAERWLFHAPGYDPMAGLDRAAESPSEKAGRAGMHG